MQTSEEDNLEYWVNKCRSLEDELRWRKERHAREIACLEHQVKQLMNPLIRAKMLQPQPPIVLQVTGEEKETILRNIGRRG